MPPVLITAMPADAPYDDHAPARPFDAGGRWGEPPRIRLVGVGLNRLGSGRSRATVTLERVDGRTVDGGADVEASSTGDLRAGAAAALDALRRADDAPRRFALLGVKSVRAFDRHVVLVQVGVAEGDEPLRALVGSAIADDDLMRASVLAVLNATNRVLWGPDRRAHLPRPPARG